MAEYDLDAILEVAAKEIVYQQISENLVAIKTKFQELRKKYKAESDLSWLSIEKEFDEQTRVHKLFQDAWNKHLLGILGQTIYIKLKRIYELFGSSLPIPDNIVQQIRPIKPPRKTQTYSKSLDRNRAHYAAISNDIKLLRECIDAKTDINGTDEDGYTPLYFAAENGNTDMVKLLIEHKSNVNLRGKFGYPLHVALEQKRHEVAEILIFKKSDINEKNKDSYTPLHQASARGLRQIVHLLLKEGALRNEKINDGSTALHLALRYDQPDIAKILIELDSDIHVVNNDGETALFEGVNKHRQNEKIQEIIEVCTILIKEGSSVEIPSRKDGMTVLHHSIKNILSEVSILLLLKGFKINTKNNQEKTPLYFLSNLEIPKVIKLLIKTGADLSERNQKGNIKLLDLILAKVNIHNINDSGRTAVGICSEKGKTEMVEYLIGKKSIIHEIDRYGFLPIDYALESNHFDTFKFLLEKGSRTDIEYDAERNTMLMLALKKKYFEIAKLIIEKKSHLNTKNYAGKSPLEVAIELERLEIINDLIHNKADINTTTSESGNLLHFALENSYKEPAILLIKLGIDTNTRKPVTDLRMVSYLKMMGWRFGFSVMLGKTPLEIAIKNRDQNTVVYLIEYRADINAACSISGSLLHYALQNGYENIAKILLHAGINVNSTDTEFKTPLQIAVQKMFTGFVRLLVEKGGDPYDKNLEGKNAFDYTRDNMILDILKSSKANKYSRWVRICKKVVIIHKRCLLWLIMLFVIAMTSYFYIQDLLSK